MEFESNLGRAVIIRYVELAAQSSVIARPRVHDKDTERTNVGTSRHSRASVGVQRHSPTPPLPVSAPAQIQSDFGPASDSSHLWRKPRHPDGLSDSTPSESSPGPSDLGNLGMMDDSPVHGRVSGRGLSADPFASLPPPPRYPLPVESNDNRPSQAAMATAAGPHQPHNVRTATKSYCDI